MGQRQLQQPTNLKNGTAEIKTVNTKSSPKAQPPISAGLSLLLIRTVLSQEQYFLTEEVWKTQKQNLEQDGTPERAA